jgi:hypothetical protein
MGQRKACLALLLVVAFGAAGCAAEWGSRHEPSQSYAPSGIDFYFDDLAPYGTWVDLTPYGWVWCPLDTPVGWRPFTVGYWIYSDDGWLWISEDPWGWTPYHYGRWTWNRDYGWVWVPGDTWAPAWVAWRYGDGWVGWAPLPPDVHWREGIGLVYTAYDLDRHINRHRWCFAAADDFGASRVRVRVEPSSRNVTLLGQTKNITKYVAGPRPVETGMDPAIFAKRGRGPIERYRIEESPTPIRERGATLGEKTVQVFRPKGGVTEVVRERVKDVPRQERPVAPPQVIRRLEEKRNTLDETVRSQRSRLEEEHQREMKERAAGESALELRRRQEAELRLQREVEEREKRVLEERERRAVQQRVRAERETEREARLRKERTDEGSAKEPAAKEQPTKKREPGPRNRGR